MHATWGWQLHASCLTDMITRAALVWMLAGSAPGLHAATVPSDLPLHGGDAPPHRRAGPLPQGQARRR